MAIRFSYEGEDDTVRDTTLVFQGVEAFKCTYLDGRGAEMLEAYDRLLDRGASRWLTEITANLDRRGGHPQGLLHLMINFDDGPCHEIICRSFHVDGA